VEKQVTLVDQIGIERKPCKLGASDASPNDSRSGRSGGGRRRSQLDIVLVGHSLGDRLRVHTQVGVGYSHDVVEPERKHAPASRNEDTVIDARG
jgi:hypothetical protein